MQSFEEIQDWNESRNCRAAIFNSTLQQHRFYNARINASF